jgi:periplasmic divalent cation tolerance protein
MTDALIVFSSFGTEEEAVRVVRTLVEERLIACGNLVPGARSIYPWKGEIQDQREVIAILKTRKQDWPALMSRLHELHSYETPECVAVRIASGAPRYMAWLDEVLGG